MPSPLDNPKEAGDILIAETNGMLSNPDLVHASMQALVDGGFLRDPGEPVGLIDPELISGILFGMLVWGRFRYDLVAFVALLVAVLAG
jgi:hypothetical protein